MNLTPRMQKRGRRRGTIFGDLLFDVRQAANEGVLYEWPESGGSSLRGFIIDRCETMYDELRNSGNLAPDVLEELEVEQVKVGVMVEGYVMQYGVDGRREIEFSLPLRNPRTSGTSRAFRRAGKIDGVVIVKPGHARIIEDKLVQNIQRVMIERLPLDDQATEYVDAFLEKGWTAEVAYRHTKWPGINPLQPKVFKTKPNYPGETMHEFMLRLLNDVTVERTDSYFDEQILWFPQDHLDDYRNGRWGTAQEIIAARAVFRKSYRDGMVTLPVQQAFPMNPSRCWEYGGCEFIPLCTKQPGAENLYVQQTDNPELTLDKNDEAVTSEYGPQQ